MTDVDPELYATDGGILSDQPVHRWYTRPVFFVSDVDRALQFYTRQLGFVQQWRSDDASVCQVHRGECEIILCRDDRRRDRSRLFIELTRDGLVDLVRDLAQRSVPHRETWWGYDTIQVDDPDGNELLFPSSEQTRAPR